METNQSAAIPGNATDTSVLQRDEVLWRIAKKRASFKWSALSYVLVNSMLVATWYFTSGMYSYFWPIWPILGWGIGVAMHYFEAYHGDSVFSAHREYEKLKNQQNKF